MSVCIGQVWCWAVVQVEQPDLSAKSADRVGDAHLFGFGERAAENNDVDGFASTHCKHLTQIMGLRDMMSGSFEVDSPVGQQRGIDADIQDVCHLHEH